FTSFCEKGDVMAAFCGHDHDNDFAVMHYGIMLAYGRYTGGNTVYNHLKPNGARVIVLKEDTRELDSWLRLRGGKTTNRLSYPDDLTR
ncbi:MAG: metallophosphatase, partial [Muribaculaceae bacterium]|nr:metallophosphatase [Muribaculaceae bacterium]